jgi:triosephosphate isomerase
MKNKFIAGNWKMNNTVSQTKDLLTKLLPLVSDTPNTVALCVPFTDIYAAGEMLKNTNVFLGAQNVHWKSSGAYTGEISAEMLAEAGVKYVIVGHSERRQYFAETDETVNGRLKAALAAQITPIMCIGESLDQRNSGVTEAFLATQLEQGLKDITAEQAQKIVFAYEPIWAIGTGVTATEAQAQETIAFVRKQIAKLFNDTVAQKVYILYGGSMNEKNAKSLLSMPDIDGGLIGGASLTAEKFAAIVRAKGKNER